MRGSLVTCLGETLLTHRPQEPTAHTQSRAKGAGLQSDSICVEKWPLPLSYALVPLRYRTQTAPHPILSLSLSLWLFFLLDIVNSQDMY